MQFAPHRFGMPRLRQLLAGLATACSLGSPALAGEIVCAPPDAQGAQACASHLPEHLVRRMAGVQEQSHWCWAAAMEMVLARHGLRVPQTSIVAAHLGRAVNVRLPTRDLPLVLAREWATAHGDRFSVRAVRQADAAAGPLPLSARLALGALEADQPLLLAANGHVVVLVGITFTRYRDARFLRVTGGTVIDPRADVGLRPLAADEMVADYLGWFEVTRPAAYALGD